MSDTTVEKIDYDFDLNVFDHQDEAEQPLSPHAELLRSVVVSCVDNSLFWIAMGAVLIYWAEV